jgi:hypothetical protein
MNKVVYIVTAYKYGDRNAHSYVVGAFEKKAKALTTADSHTVYRGAKYGCVVDEVGLNEYKEDGEY